MIKHAAHMVSTVASPQEGPGLIPGVSVPSLHVLPVCLWVFSSYSGFLPQPNKMPKLGIRLIGLSKLSIVATVSVDD